jgi:hypothetical protein
MNFESAPMSLGVASLDPNIALLALASALIVGLTIFSIKREMAFFAFAAAALSVFLINT